MSARTPSAIDLVNGLSPSLRRLNPHIVARALGASSARGRAQPWRTFVDHHVSRAGDEVTVILKGLSLVSEANARGHWREKAERVAWQRSILRNALAALAPPDLTDGRRWTVTIDRTTQRALDEGDNLAVSAKAIRDGVAAWLGVDDSPSSPVRWIYTQRVTPRTKAPRWVRIHLAPEVTP